MGKTVVIHQPDFLPHIGFFHRFLYADLWVMLDNVQFVNNSSRSWQNRDKIKTKKGEKWITVAIQRCHRETKINEVLLSGKHNWREGHLNLIRENYRASRHFDEVYPYIEKLYSFECSKLMDFNIESIDMLSNLFDINIPRIFASTLNPEGKKNELLIDILKKVGADKYLSGPGARDYLEHKLFDESGIKVAWQNFRHPEYSQPQGDFISYLSSIDLLLNCGIEKSREILRRC